MIMKSTINFRRKNVFIGEEKWLKVGVFSEKGVTDRLGL